MSRRVSFKEPLALSPRQTIRRSSPRRPLSNRRSSPRQPLSIRRSSPRRQSANIQRSSRLTFEFTSNIYDLSNIEQLLAQNNIPYSVNENSIDVDLINPEPRQVKIVNQLIDQAWEPLQRQLQQLVLL